MKASVSILIVSLLLFMFSPYAFGEGSESGTWQKIADNEDYVYYIAPDMVASSGMNINSFVRFYTKKTGDYSIMNAIFRCDEWKVTFIDIEPFFANKHRPFYVKPTYTTIDVVKASPAATTFNYFCTKLHEQKPEVKDPPAEAKK